MHEARDGLGTARASLNRKSVPLLRADAELSAPRLRDVARFARGALGLRLAHWNFARLALRAARRPLELGEEPARAARVLLDGGGDCAADAAGCAVCRALALPIGAAILWRARRRAGRRTACRA